MATIRKDTLSLKKKGVAAAKGGDQDEVKVDDCPPPDMYTHPASEHNYQYSEKTVVLPRQQKRRRDSLPTNEAAVNNLREDREKYQGDPRADLMGEIGQ